MRDPGGRLSSRELSFWMTAAAVAGIIFIGARFIVEPAVGADGYGVPAPMGVSVAYLWAKGIRDIVSGLIGAAFLVAGWRRSLIHADRNVDPDVRRTYCYSVCGSVPITLGYSWGNGNLYGALALRLPVDQPEPFGPALIEAHGCGIRPDVAFHRSHGCFDIELRASLTVRLPTTTSWARFRASKFIDSLSHLATSVPFVLSAITLPSYSASSSNLSGGTRELMTCSSTSTCGLGLRRRSGPVGSRSDVPAQDPQSDDSSKNQKNNSVYDPVSNV